MKRPCENPSPFAPRLLEGQIQQQTRAHAEEYNKLLEEVKRLRKEKEEQQNLLAQSLVLSEDARVEAGLKHEITRLTRENLVRQSGEASSLAPTAKGWAEAPDALILT